MGTQVSFPELDLRLTVYETAFSIGQLDIKWGAILISLGIVLAVVFALRQSHDFGVDSDRYFDVVMLSLVAAGIGARLSHVLFSAGGYASFGDLVNVRDGGFELYGGLVFGMGAAILLCRWRKVKFLPAADMTAMGLLVGQAVGVWSDFVTQRAFGNNTTSAWGMYSNETAYYLSRNAVELAEKGMLVDAGEPVHPLFFYRSLWCVAGFILLYLYRKKRRFDGEMFLMYLVWCGVGWAFIDRLQVDSLYFGHSTVQVSQALAIVCALAAIAVMFIVRRKIAKSDDANYLIPYGNTKEAEEMLMELTAERELAAKERLEKRALKKVEQDSQVDEKKKDTDKAQKDVKSKKEEKSRAAGKAKADEKPKKEEKSKVADKAKTDDKVKTDDKPQKGALTDAQKAALKAQKAKTKAVPAGKKETTKPTDSKQRTKADTAKTAQKTKESASGKQQPKAKATPDAAKTDTKKPQEQKANKNKANAKTALAKNADTKKTGNKDKTTSQKSGSKSSKK